MLIHTIMLILMENIHLLRFCALFMILSGSLALQVEDLAYMIQLIHLI
ncbi:MAG: hypothetical protein EZS28_026674, partial [Streblomastix strix]